jgi:hypothetical protein
MLPPEVRMVMRMWAPNQEEASIISQSIILVDVFQSEHESPHTHRSDLDCTWEPTEWESNDLPWILHVGLHETSIFSFITFLSTVYTSITKFCEELIVYFPLIWYRLHKKWCVQQFFYCECIHHGVTFLQSCCLAMIRGYTHTLMGGIYEVCGSDGLTCHDIHTTFHKDQFKHSKVDGGGSQTAWWLHKLAFIFSE